MFSLSLLALSLPRPQRVYPRLPAELADEASSPRDTPHHTSPRSTPRRTTARAAYEAKSPGGVHRSARSPRAACVDPGRAAPIARLDAARAHTRPAHAPDVRRRSTYETPTLHRTNLPRTAARARPRPARARV